MFKKEKTFFEKIQKLFNMKRILIIFIILSVTLVLLQTNSFIRADEFWYFDAAKSVLTAGQPLIKFCDNSTPQLFVGHPTTYIYYLAGFLLIFPEQLIKLSGLPFFLLNILLIFFIGKQIFKKKETAMLASALYTISPLAIQGTLLLDIDNTILSTALLVFCLASVYSFKEKGLEKISIILSFALVLGMKFTVFFILIAGVIISKILEKKKVIESILLLVSGFIIFLLSWFVVSLLVNYPPFSIFDYILQQFSTSGGIDLYGKIVTIIYSGLKTNLLWFTLPLTALFVLGLKNKKTRFLAILSIIAFLQYLFSVPSAYRFPKYMAAFFPLIIIVATGIFDIEEIKFKTKHLLWIFFPGIIFALFQKDPLAHAKDFFSAGYIAIINCVTLLPWIILKHKKEILLTLYIGSCFYINLFQLITPTSTLYNYGENGLQETIEFVGTNFDGFVFMPGREIGYYTNTKQYCFFEITKIIEETKQNCVNGFVLKKGWDDKIHPPVFETITTNYELIGEFGDYLVYDSNACQGE